MAMLKFCIHSFLNTAVEILKIIGVKKVTFKLTRVPKTFKNVMIVDV